MSRLYAAAFAAALALLAWWIVSRPVEVPGRLDGRLSSVSFSPYRAGQSPLTRIYPSAQELEADLALVATIAGGVRTYTSLEGFDRVPPLAARHGLKATMGAWLTTDREHNRREVEALIKVANDHPQTVARVIVGNETLVRHEITVDELIALLREVRARVRQPVSYADVPVVWHHYPQLAQEVDLLTVHVLPYWEDRAVPYAQTEAYLLDTVRAIRERFPGKPILIGESGWPADGRPRGPALPGRAEQAGYLRMLARVSAANGFDYNVIEAFDQPWKGALEGLVGAHWGVFDFDRNLKYPSVGPIEPMPGWERRAGFAVVLGALMFLAAASRARLVRAGPLFMLAIAAQLLSTLMLFAVGRELDTAFTPHDLARAWVEIALMVPLAIAALFTGCDVAADRVRGAGHIGVGLLLATVLLGLQHSWRLAFHGHLLDFPLHELMVPAACVALLAAAHRARGWPWIEAIALHDLFRTVRAPRSIPPWMRWPARLMAMLLMLSALGVLGGEAFEAVRDDFGRDQAFLGRLERALSWLGATGAANAWTALLLFLSLPFIAAARFAHRHR